MEKEKKLIKNTLLYTISNFGSKVLVFIIVLLYTYLLSTSEFGEYDTIISLVQLIMPIAMLSINEAILRWLLKSKDDNKKVIYTGLLCYLIFMTLSLIIIFIFNKFINYEYSFIMSICLFSISLNELFQFSARGLKRNKVFAVSGIIQTIGMIIFNLIFIIVFKAGINGMLVSFALSQILSVLFLIYKLKDIIEIKIANFDKTLAKQMVKYSVMLVPNTVSWWIMNSSDKLMLTNIKGADYTGIYSVATKFPSIINMLHMLFYRAWQEQAVLEYDSKDKNEYYTKIFNVYSKILLSIILLIIPVSKIYILLTMSVEYVNSYKYIGILLIAAVFSAFSSFYGTGYISSKETKKAAYTTMIGAFINFFINVLLIERIGIWATCLSTLIGYLVTWLIRIKQTKKYFNIKVNWKVLIMLIVLNSIYCLLVLIDNYLITLGTILLGIIIIICVNKREIKEIKKLIKNRFNYKKSSR